MIQFQKIAKWTAAVFLAIVFVYAGSSKLHGASAVRWAGLFAHWGYPARVAYAVGVIELVAGLGVLIPRSRRAASLILGILMIGALYTHVVNAEFPRVVPPLVLGGLSLLLAWRPR